MMFRKSKVKKAQEVLVSDVKIIIPSAENFFAHFRRNLVLGEARVDAQAVLGETEQDRIRNLMNNFDTIAAEALVDALIDAGYKKESKSKWKIKNWF